MKTPLETGPNADPPPPVSRFKPAQTSTRCCSLAGVLRRADRDARVASAGVVRRARAGCDLTRLRIGGVVRAAVAFGILSAIPFGFTQPWVQNLFIFTLMYAALASAWNIIGGYSGYISLGHAAFFGVGAYAIGI